MTTQPAGGYRDRNSTADRALTLLELFTEDRSTISAADAAAELGVARSTAYRYVQSLTARGYLEEAPTGGFRLGLKVLELARLARRGFGLSEVALPHMRSLCLRFRQTVLLTRRSGPMVMCLEREMPPGRLINISYERGAQLPVTAGASALILLAWLPHDEAWQLMEAAENNDGGASEHGGERHRRLLELTELLKTTRRHGYCVTHAHVDPDTVGLAAPIVNRAGDVLAGLSIVALENRVAREQEQDMVAALRETATAISRTLELAD